MRKKHSPHFNPQPLLVFVAAILTVISLVSCSDGQYFRVRDANTPLTGKRIVFDGVITGFASNPFNSDGDIIVRVENVPLYFRIPEKSLMDSQKAAARERWGADDHCEAFRNLKRAGKLRAGTKVSIRGGVDMKWESRNIENGQYVLWPVLQISAK